MPVIKNIPTPPMIVKWMKSKWGFKCEGCNSRFPLGAETRLFKNAGEDRFRNACPACWAASDGPAETTPDAGGHAAAPSEAPGGRTGHVACPACGTVLAVKLSV